MGGHSFSPMGKRDLDTTTAFPGFGCFTSKRYEKLFTQEFLTNLTILFTFYQIHPHLCLPSTYEGRGIEFTQTNHHVA